MLHVVYPSVSREEGFDPGDGKWHVLGCRVAADIPTSPGGTAYDPWQVAGETPTAPDGTNDEDGGSDYANPAAPQPGNAHPFMSWGATMKLVPGGYVPACRSQEGYNHYRRFVRLAPRMFGSSGRDLLIYMDGMVLSTIATGVMDIVLQPDLVTSCNGGGANTTTFDANKRFGFRFPLGVLTAESAFQLFVRGSSMGPHQSIWSAHLVVGHATTPQTSDPALDLKRGPFKMDFTTPGPDFDTTGCLLAFLYAARGSTACNLYDINVAGTGATQDGTKVRIRGGKCLALLTPGR